MPNVLALVDALYWHASRSRPLLWWMGFLVWLAVGVRLTLTTGLTARGVLDDVAFACAWAVPFVLLEALPRAGRVVVQGALALGTAAAVLADTLHYRFFHAFVNFESILLAREMTAAATSVRDLVTAVVVAWGIVVPIALMSCALVASGGYRSRRTSWASVVLIALATFAWAGRRVTGEATLAPAHTNPLLLVARQAFLGASFDTMGSDEEVLADARRDIGAVFNAPPEREYLRGTSERHPLLRLPTSRVPREERARPNVVLLLMESVREYEARASDAGASEIMPSLSRLAERGLTALHHYAIGHQTVRGEGPILCGIVDHFGGAPIYVRYPSVRIKCLPEILRDDGYATHWISSFSRDYFNKQSFLSQHGVERFHDMREVKRGSGRPWVGWGPADEDLMAYATRILSRSKEPFFAEVMTVSNHHPFDHRYPISPPREAGDVRHAKLYRDYLRGVHYTDHSIGAFFELAKDEPWFENTIFVITGDHGTPAAPHELDDENNPTAPIELFYRSPLVVLGPGIEPRKLDVVSSHVDIAPTVLDLLGLTAPNSFAGVSLLADIAPEDRFALFTSEDRWHIRQGNRYCYAIGRGCLDDGFPRCPGDMGELPAGHACFQTERDLLDFADDTLGPALEVFGGEAAHRMLWRGDRIVRLTRMLLQQDSVYPYREPSD